MSATPINLPSSPQVLQPAVIPYWIEKQQFPPDLLSRIYQKMVDQGLDREVLHSRSILEAGFIEFIESNLTSIFLDLNGSYAGLAWLEHTEQTDTILKAIGGFVFFREYWHPKVTKVFGDMFLGQSFNVLGYDLIYGLTPRPNRLAQRFCKRLGFRYLDSPIPGFLSYHGETVDALLCTLTREQFNSRE